MVLRMMLGGVPVSVAIPPMLAAKAVQRAKVFVRRMNCSVGVVVPRSTSLLSLKDLLDCIMPFHYYRSTDLTFLVLQFAHIAHVFQPIRRYHADVYLHGMLINIL